MKKLLGSGVTLKRGVYHRRCACTIPGLIEVGGLARVVPVWGLTIGMTFLARAAAGCWKCMALTLLFMAAAATLLT